MPKKILLVLFFFTGTAFFSSFSVKIPQKVLRTVIIDAGHGGKDQGAAGLISTEAQLCLEISMKLGKEIEEKIPGVKVLYTRTADILPGNKNNKDEALRYRADFANQSGADLFLSIHCNSIGKGAGGWYEKRIIGYNNKYTYQGKGKKKKKIVTKIPVYQPYYVVNTTTGTETFIWTAKENSHKTQIVGSHTEFSGEQDSTITVPENDPVINAMKLVYTKKYFKNSYQLADFVQTEFEKAGRINRGVKQRNEKGIWVLHATGMPSVLIETGFISNKEEELYLNSDKGQAEVVTNITDALKNYISWLEKQQSQNGSTTNVSRSSGESNLPFLEMIADKEEKRSAK